jgi:hypothetical protein
MKKIDIRRTGRLPQGKDLKRYIRQEPKIVILTQDEYDAIPKKNTHTLYFIVAPI